MRYVFLYIKAYCREIKKLSKIATNTPFKWLHEIQLNPRRGLSTIFDCLIAGTTEGVPGQAAVRAQV